MKLGHLELFVSDVKRSVEFYTKKLGFELVADQEKFQWIKLGEFEIMLREGENPKVSNYQSASHGLVIYTDDVAKAGKTLQEKGVKFEKKDMGCITFKDPDGHWFQLVNPNH